MSAWTLPLQILTHTFLFLLVFGMTSTIPFHSLLTQLHNARAVLLGLVCQFLLLPFLGYLMVVGFQLPPAVGITLIILVSSPGGSYSNWWCSLWNADLALSVTMTTISTVMSVGCLPVNLFLYSHLAYGGMEWTSGGDSGGGGGGGNGGGDGAEDGGGVGDEIADTIYVLEAINFGVIFISIGVVISAIGLGILCSYQMDHVSWWHKLSYILGNLSGILLIVFSTFLSFWGSAQSGSPTVADVTTSENEMHYVAIVLPCLLGLAIATILARVANLSKPERLAVAVECCYQNTGIATSAAMSLFRRDRAQLKMAMRVPVVYGLVEAIAICIYLFTFWKLGWTKAPKDEQLCVVIAKSYEMEFVPKEEDRDGHSDEGKDEILLSDVQRGEGEGSYRLV